jgi:RimJ/RimL family protein N-acetyltransferase
MLPKAMEKWFPFETERLLLREFVATDERDIHEYAADLEVVRYVRGARTRLKKRVPYSALDFKSRPYGHVMK